MSGFDRVSRWTRKLLLRSVFANEMNLKWSSCSSRLLRCFRFQIQKTTEWTRKSYKNIFSSIYPFYFHYTLMNNSLESFSVNLNHCEHCRLLNQPRACFIRFKHNTRKVYTFLIRKTNETPQANPKNIKRRCNGVWGGCYFDVTSGVCCFLKIWFSTKKNRSLI